MSNRLASATSPYLLQHADNPVDWWEWGPEPFEEARRRDVPVLLSVGYAACHWCHVMAHESFEDEATAALPERALRQHQGRPRGTARRRRGLHAGDHRDDRARRLADDRACSTTTAGRSSPAPTSPTGRGTGSPPSGRCCGARRGVARAQRRGAAGRRAAARAPAPAAGGGRGADRAGDARRAPSTCWRASSTPCAAGSGARRSSRRRWCWSSCSGEGPSGRSRWPRRRSRRWPAGGIHDQLGGGFARYSVDADWVVPHFEKMLYDNALLLGVYAGWAAPDPSACWVARGDRRLPARRAADRGGRLRLGARRRLRGRRGHLLRLDARAAHRGARCRTTARGRPRCSGVTEAGTFEHGASMLQLRERPRRPRALVRVRAALLGPRAMRERPARDDKVVAAWNGLAIAGLRARPGRSIEPRRTSTRRCGAGELLWTCTGRRPAAAGLA